MRIRLKNENCVRAGCGCGCDEDRQCGDCTEWEVSREMAMIKLAAAEASRGGKAAYERRIALQIIGNLPESDRAGLPAVEWSARDGRYVAVAD